MSSQLIGNLFNQTFFPISALSNSSSNHSNVGIFTALPVTFTLFTSFALLFNGLVLLVFLCDRSLWTPFNMYLVNLLIAKILVSGLQNPFEIIDVEYTDWWLGGRTCVFYLYTSYVLQAGVSGAHVLIVVNRTWAIMHPISYRAIHSKRTAALLCLGMWIYNHVVLLAGIIPDALNTTKPNEDLNCELNDQAIFGWAVTVQVIIFNSPQLIMITSCLVIVCRKCGRRRRIGRTSDGIKHEVSLSTLMKNTARRASPAVAAIPVKVPEISHAFPYNARPSAKRETHANTMLMLLTVSSTICWTPLDVYYTVGIFQENFDMPTFYQAGQVLHMFQVVVDPILFTVSSLSLLRAAKRLFRL